MVKKKMVDGDQGYGDSVTSNRAQGKHQTNATSGATLLTAVTPYFLLCHVTSRHLMFASMMI